MVILSKKPGTVITLLILVAYVRCLAQEPGLTEQSNNIRNYLTRVATEVSDRSLADVTSLSDWQTSRDQRYQQFIEMIGLFDAPLNGVRPPLNIRKVGTIRKDGYRIEKLYYESLPGLYVPANLYIPDNLKGRVPAILYVCGHARTQKAHYQAHPRRFAELGFVCLIIETIQWGEVLGEHWGCYARGWFHWYSRGYNPGGVELWNAIRGLDLLTEMPEVDGERLGVTGISGGGAQSWFIAAADPRIKAVAPVCGTSTVKAHVGQRTIDGHCDCMMPTNVYRQDIHDLGALIAPRPLLIASSDGDGLNSIESVRESYGHIKRIYDLYGRGDVIHLIETPGGHSYHEISRTRIFSFFLKHLFNKTVDPSVVGDLDESETSQLPVEELAVYSTGPPQDDRTKTIQDSFVRVAQTPVIETAGQLQSHRTSVVDFLRSATFGAFSESQEPLAAKLEFRADDGARFGGQTYSFVPEQDWRLKVDIRWRAPRDAQAPLVLVLRNPDEERWASEDFISGVAEDINIAYFSARGIGESGWSPALQWHVRRAAAWTGRTIASMRVYDVLRCLAFLRSIEGIGDIQIAARGEMGVVAIYAGLLDDRVSGLLLQNLPGSQNRASQTDGRGEAIEMLHVLRVTDLPQAAGLLFPRQVAILGEMPSSYNWAASLYATLGQPDAFQRLAAMSEWRPREQ